MKYGVAAEKVPFAICGKIKQSLEGGEIQEGLSPLQVAEWTVKQVMKCADFLRHLADNQKVQLPIQRGRIEGLKTAMAMMVKARDTELEKADLNRKAEASGEPLRGLARPSGVHPGPSQAGLRKAAEGAKEAHGSLAERRAAAKAERERVAETTSTEQPLVQKPPRKGRRDAKAG